MSDDTSPLRHLSCVCGRAIRAATGVEVRRVRELTEVGEVVVVSVGGRFHHVCSVT